MCSYVHYRPALPRSVKFAFLEKKRRRRRTNAGALVGGLIIGAAEVLSIQYIDPLLSDVAPFAVLLAMLLVRPWGLFGTREELDRV